MIDKTRLSDEEDELETWDLGYDYGVLDFDKSEPHGEEERLFEDEFGEAVDIAIAKQEDEEGLSEEELEAREAEIDYLISIGKDVEDL